MCFQSLSPTWCSVLDTLARCFFTGPALFLFICLPLWFVLKWHEFGRFLTRRYRDGSTELSIPRFVWISVRPTCLTTRVGKWSGRIQHEQREETQGCAMAKWPFWCFCWICWMIWPEHCLLAHFHFLAFYLHVSPACCLLGALDKSFCRCAWICTWCLSLDVLAA